MQLNMSRSAVSLRAHAHNEIRYFRGGLNPGAPGCVYRQPNPH